MPPPSATARIFLTASAFLLGLPANVLAVSDPCIDHELIGGMGERSMESDLLPSDKALCDKTFKTESGWYRVIHDEDSGRMGEDMPTWPPGVNHCGTVYPIWINGTLPRNRGETVERPACSDGWPVKSGPSARCFEQRNVKVKNCGDYNVYWLPRPASCPHAYCFGVVPCPPGLTSPTGLEPLCRVPDLIDTPIVDWDVDDQSTDLRFRCLLPRPASEAGVFLNVTWSLVYKAKFGEASTTIAGENGVAANDLPVFLTKAQLPLDFRLNAQISCEMSPWAADGRVGPTQKSQPFFAGIEVSPTEITMLEGESRAIRLKTTVPLICSPRPSADGCRIAIAAYVSPPPPVSDPCSPYALPENTVLMDDSRCGALIQGLRPHNQEEHIRIVATTDGKFGSSGDAVSRRIKLNTVAFADIDPIWKGLELPYVQVKISDADRTSPSGLCYSNDDPHMQTFDRRPYEMHMQGSFILYQNVEHHQEVQSFYQPCMYNNMVTCNCAVAVRSGQDVFILDACNKIRKSTNTRGRFFRVGVVGCNDRGMTVTSTGGSYQITLPTKTVIKISFNSDGPYSVSIIPSSRLDVNTTGGLCGFFSGSQKDDFVRRDATFQSDYTPEFANDWRIPVEDSIFVRLASYGYESVKAATNNSRKTIAYCRCDAEPPSNYSDGDTISELSCARSSTMASVSCKDSSKVPPTCKVKENANTGDLLFESFDYIYDGAKKDEQVPDWRNGWTEAKATTHCRNYLINNEAVKMCSAVPNVNVDRAVQQCILDIKLMGNTEYQFVSLEQIILACKVEVERNVTSWIPDTKDGALKPPAKVVNALCPNNCSSRGECVNGLCSCRDFFFGADCSSDERTPPRIETGVDICNIQSSSCLLLHVYGWGFAAKQSNVTCKFETTTVNGSTDSSVSSAEYQTGRVINLAEVACEAPRSLKEAIADSRLPKKYTVSISNDGNAFSNAIFVLVYDSRCHACNEATKTCAARADVCIISGRCYAANSSNPGNHDLRCRPESSTTDWTIAEETRLPDIKEAPVVEWRLLKTYHPTSASTSELAFTCSLGHPAEPLLNFDVTWKSQTRVNGSRLTRVMHTVRNVTQDSLPHILHPRDWGADFKFGVEVFCELVPYYTTSNRKGGVLSSAPLFAGIEVSPKTIILPEGEKQVIRLWTTIPMLCLANASSEDCELAVAAFVSPPPTSGQCTPYRLSENNVLIDDFRCGTTIRGLSHHKNNSHSQTALLTVVATIDGRFGTPNDAVIKFVKLKTIGPGAIAPAWHWIELPEIMVTVVDKDKLSPSGLCYSEDDPHMQTFDRRPYEMHMQGSFVLYRHRYHEIEVQTFYQPCRYNNRVTCNCAVAVRSGQDVFILDACDKTRKSTNTTGKFFRVGTVGCINRGMTVSFTGSSYEVTLPTSTVVKISFNTNGPYSVSIIPHNKFDLNATEGLCGLFSGSQVDDYLLRDGNFLPDYSPDFANEWRVPVEESLFVNLPRYGGSTSGSATNSSEVQSYCACNADRSLSLGFGNDYPELRCTMASLTVSGRCKDIAAGPSTCNVKETANAGDLLFESFDYIYDGAKPIDEVPVWKNGWTEAKAQDHCRHFLLNSDVAKSCSALSNVNVNRAIQQCILDIKLTGTTEYQFVSLEQIQVACKAEVDRNVTTWVPDSTNGTLKPPASIINALCPSNCTNRGACIDGMCSCRTPYYGADCSADDRTPPALEMGNGICDVNRSSCLWHHTYGWGFTVLSNITCKFETLQVAGAIPAAPVTEYQPGRRVSFAEVACAAPKALLLAIAERRLPQRYYISVSNDGRNFSNKISILVYDSSCHACNEMQGTCSPTIDVCIISGVCYARNSLNPAKKEQKCDPGLNPKDWITAEEARLPIIKQAPVVGWRLIKSPLWTHELPTQLAFTCSIAHPDEHLLAFDVTWKTETRVGSATLVKVIHTVRNVSQDRFPVTLQKEDWGADFKLGVKIICEIQPYYVTSKVKGHILASQPLFAGIEVSPTILTLTEGETASITLRPTVPITCEANASQMSCFTRISMSVSPLQKVPSPPSSRDNCPGGAELTPDVLFDNAECGIILDGTWAAANETWKGQSKSITIVSTVDGKFGISDVTRKVISLQTAGMGEAALPWRGITLPDVQVTILDKDKLTRVGQCFSNDDPYMRTFDLTTYHMHLQGPFVLYRHRTYPTEVQVFYQPCPGRPGSTCNCGAAVRSETEIFIYDACAKTHVQTRQTGKFFRAGIVSCGNPAIQVTSTGTSYEVITATGTKISIAFNSNGPYNINVVTSVLDYNSTLGLCGVYNGQTKDDFTGSDGTVHLRYSDQFAVSWRLRFEDSLFANLKTYGEAGNRSLPSAPDKTLTLCTCEDGTSNRNYSSVTCAKTSIARKDCTTGSVGGKATVPTYCAAKNNGIFFDEFTYLYDGASKSNPAPGWSNGWSESSARAHCTGYLQNATLTRGCAVSSSTDLSTSVQQCIEGIRLSGTTAFDFTALEQLRFDCQTEATRNATATNGTSVPGNLDFCPNDCSNNGKCSKGTCTCNTHYVGADCSEDVRVPPTLDAGIGSCDRSRNRCDWLPVYGSGVSAHSGNLTCKIELVEMSLGMTPSSSIVITKGIFIGYGEVHCPVPGSVHNSSAPLGLNVSVSNDGLHFGYPVFVVIFDGTCISCNSTTIRCIIQPSMCYISGKCYANGSASDADASMTCQPVTSQTSWTTKVTPASFTTTWPTDISSTMARPTLATCGSCRLADTDYVRQAKTDCRLIAAYRNQSLQTTAPTARIICPPRQRFSVVTCSCSPEADVDCSC